MIKRNLVIPRIDNRKAYDMIPNFGVMEGMNLFGIMSNDNRSHRKIMAQLRMELIAYG